jgi:hypothetical protein
LLWVLSVRGRYSRPLNRTREKKFRALQALGAPSAIEFLQDLRLPRFTEHAHFSLLPKLPLPVLRYAEMFMLGPFLVLWLICRHGVPVLVAQSPYVGFAAYPSGGSPSLVVSLREAKAFTNAMGAQHRLEVISEGCLVGPQRGSVWGRLRVRLFPNLFSPCYIALLRRKEV